MKKFTFLLFACSSLAQAQTSTFESVYAVLQSNCASCHVAGHVSGLDLSGSIADVYDKLYNVSPTNATSAAKAYKRVYPGDPYKSFIFNKINNGLALDVTLAAGEGVACPQGGASPLSNKDIELVRQWIIYGAMDTGTQVDEALIADFYDNGGITSIASPPAPPAPGTGFQIHYGPFFLWPDGESEYFSKYDTKIPADIEVKRMDTYMGPYSHHFITYKYDNLIGYYSKPYGLRLNNPEYFGVSLVTAHQYSDSVSLPPKTAFMWGSDTHLDLDSHYINYSSEKSLSCEAYLNVYTQPVGTALYQMHTDLPADYDIYIPNDGAVHTFSDAIYDNTSNDEIFVWAISTHTHKYGVDYDVYKRNADGSRGEHIVDASCESTNGAPDCITQIYDYQHPPTRKWDNFLPIKVKEGIIHEASWINDGPVPVSFGLTSNDEMMVLIYFYIDDTTGLNIPTAINTPGANDFSNITVFPNPATDVVYVQVNNLDANNLTVNLIDMTGKIISVKNYDIISSAPQVIKINRNNLPAGMYVINILDSEGNSVSRKILMQ